MNPSSASFGCAREETAEFLRWRRSEVGKRLDLLSPVLSKQRTEWTDGIDSVLQLQAYALCDQWTIDMLVLDLVQIIKERSIKTDGITCFDCFISYIVQNGFDIFFCT